MDRHELGTGIAQATRVQLRIAAWLLIALGGVGAARAAGVLEARGGLARVQLRIGGETGQLIDGVIRRLPQPYGTGYEARMSSGAAAGALGAAGVGPQGTAASPAGPRGGNGKGR